MTTDAVHPDMVPVAAGRHVRLRAIHDDDYPFLHELVSQPAVAVRWRNRGIIESPEDFRRSMWHGVLAQFVVERLSEPEMVGMVTAYETDFNSGFSHVAVVVAPRFHRLLWPLEGFRLLVDYLFDTFPLRKLYVESIDFNFARIARTAADLFRAEGVLKAHQFHMGEYRDLHILAIYRDSWRQIAKPGEPLRRASR